MSNLILTSTVLKAKKKNSDLITIRGFTCQFVTAVTVFLPIMSGYNTNILNVVNRYGLSVTDMFRLSYALLFLFL